MHIKFLGPLQGMCWFVRKKSCFVYFNFVFLLDFFFSLNLFILFLWKKKHKKRAWVSVLWLFQVVQNFTNTRGVTWRSSVAENFCQKKKNLVQTCKFQFLPFQYLCLVVCICVKSWFFFSYLFCLFYFLFNLKKKINK